MNFYSSLEATLLIGRRKPQLKSDSSCNEMGLKCMPELYTHDGLLLVGYLQGSMATARRCMCTYSFFMIV